LHNKATERFTRRLYLLPIEKINVSRHVLERLNEEVPGGATAYATLFFAILIKYACTVFVTTPFFLIDSDRFGYDV
jgi:hypothetical protein